MAQEKTHEREHTNGRNGISGIWAASEQEEQAYDIGIQLRKNLAILAITGNLSDAQGLYYSVPGSTLEGWLALERSILPIRRFVLEAEDPYIGIFSATSPWGVPTPAGDCAEDALPVELRNPYRAAEKKRIQEKGD